MAESQSSNSDTWCEQNVKFIREIKTMILAYLFAIKKITEEEKSTAVVIAVKRGFEVYINIPNCTSRVGTQQGLFNICKSGVISLTINKVCRPNFNNVNYSNSANYQQESVNHESSNIFNSRSSHIPNTGEVPHISVSFTTDINSLTVSEQTDAAEEPVLPDPNLASIDNRYTYTLTSDCDKMFTLTVVKNKRCDNRNIDGCTISRVTNNGRCDVVIKKEIVMGARKERVQAIVLCPVNVTLRVEEKDVLMIDSLECYKEELYIRGQMGPSKELNQALLARRKNKEKVDTYMRYIVFSGFIFEVDYYNYYIYKIIGKVYLGSIRSTLPGLKESQWPWHDAGGNIIECPFNNVVEYADLREGIPHNSFDDFFVAFSKILTQGHFCESIPYLENKRVLQLSLALAYSEVIRWFETYEWNNLLLSHRTFFESVDDVKEAIKHHPMASVSTFEKRRTGYQGKTSAASRRVGPFEKFLNLIKNQWLVDSRRRRRRTM